MSIKIYVQGNLANVAKGKRLFEVNGKTVGECLNHLINLMPTMKEVLFYEAGEELFFVRGLRCWLMKRAPIKLF